MISFDTENPGGILHLVIFYDGTDYFVFDKKDYDSEAELQRDVIRFILTHPETYYAHNLEYDLNCIFYKDNLDYLELYYNGRLIYGRLASSKKHLFLDSFNFSFSRLEALGKIIGVEKMETDDFYNIEYCKRDAKIVYDYMAIFMKSMEEYNAKTFFTLAGTAQNLFLKKYDEYGVGGLNTDTDLLKGYYGGRCECFFIGEMKQTIYEIDVNSMYPYVMTFEYPTDNYKETYEKPDGKMYIAYIEVEIDENTDFPILPFRGERLLFPVGKFKTWASSVEIEAAIKYKQIKHIRFLRCFSFFETHPIFSEYVEEFYSLRKEAKETGDEFKMQFYKLLLNSTYGRFGLHKQMNAVVPLWKYPEADPLDDFIGMIDVEMNSDKNKNFALAIFITAYARVKLFEMLTHVTEIGGKPLYCDTDSCYFTMKHSRGIQNDIVHLYEHLPISKRLGDVSINAYHHGGFFNAKMYYTELFSETKKIKIKGIRKDKREEYLKKGKVTYSKPIKLRAALRGVKGHKANEWVDSEIVKKSDYKKRIILKDGDTRPIKMESPE